MTPRASSGLRRDIRGEPHLDLERDLVCIGDADKGSFRSLNRAWEWVLGWSRQEMLGRPALDFVHPDDVSRTASVLARLRRPEYHVAEFENRCRHRDGSYRWLSWSARSDGEQILGVAVDITERKTREERLVRTLDDDHMLAFRQPIITVGSEEVERGELLIRLRGDGGVIEPRCSSPPRRSSA